MLCEPRMKKAVSQGWLVDLGEKRGRESSHVIGGGEECEGVFPLAVHQTD